jgi:hypothetical protein
MRFSNYLLTAGLSALALSAPVARDRDDECEWNPGEALFHMLFICFLLLTKYQSHRRKHMQ